MTIAIVDDAPIVCQSLETILTATGAAQVLWTANDGDKAVERYCSSPASRPDVLLIDIQMPGRDGLDSAREILERDPEARIIFLTTFADRKYITQAMALGAKGYLIKQDVAAVAPAIHAVMAGQVVLGSDVLGKLTNNDDKTNLASPDRCNQSHAVGNPSCTESDEEALSSLLSDGEREVAALVAEGLDNRDIARRLYLSEGTVRNRVSGALDKLGLNNRTQLAILWINTHR